MIYEDEPETREPAPGHSRARAKLEAICVRVAGRTHVNHACALEGVPRSSLYALIDADEDARLMLDAARAEAAESRRNEIEKLALGIPNEGMSAPNANVLLHLLERSHPDEYAPPKTRTEVSGVDGGSIKTEATVQFYVPANPRIPTGTE